MEIWGRKYLLLVLIITQHCQASKIPTFETTVFGEATSTLNPLQSLIGSSTPYAEMTSQSNGMSDETYVADTFSSVSTEEIETSTLINKDKGVGIVSNTKERWVMKSPSSKTSRRGKASDDDVDKVRETTISHRNDTCMDPNVRNTGRKHGTKSLSESAKVFEDVSSYSAIAIGTVSTVFNILNIMVYCKQSTASATLIIVLSIVDVLDCSALVIREITNFAINISRDVIVHYIWNNYRHFLKRVSRTINMIISLDRFLVLSREVNSRNIIQKFPKTVTGLIIVFLFCFTLAESIGLRMSSTVHRKETLDSNGTGTSHCDGLNIVVNSNATLDEMPNVTTSVDISEVTTMQWDVTDVTETSDLVITTHSALNGTDKSPPKLNSIHTTFLIFNIIYTYIMFILIFIFNIATVVFLRRHAAKRKRLGISTAESQSKQEERKQSVILITMTTVYVVLALPVSVIQFISMSQISVFSRRNAMSFAWVSEMITTGSDFIVFLIMSSSFRKKLSSFFCPSKA